MFTLAYADLEMPGDGMAGDEETWSETQAQILALRTSQDLRADAGDVDARRAELDLLLDFDPGLETIFARPQGGSGVVVTFESGVFPDPVAFRSALPETFGVRHVEPIFAETISLLIVLPEDVRFAAVANWILAEVEGVATAVPDEALGDSGDIRYHEAEALYVFERAWGDCPSGCTYSDARYFHFGAEGVVEVAYEDLDLVFGDSLPIVPRSKIRAAMGDDLIISELESSPLATVEVRTGNHLPIKSRFDGVRKLASDQDFGNYLVRIERPYGLPSVEHGFALEKRSPAPDLLTGRRHLNGWLEHARIGWTWDQHFPWTWNESHGWLYVSPLKESVDAAWAWETSLGWVFLSNSHYPWIYAQDSWLLYIRGTHSPRIFFDATSGTYRPVD